MKNQEQLRKAIGQYIKQNGNKALETMKSSGVKLSQQEEQSVRSGNLEGFSDQQLEERFNSKVLGFLGIDLEGKAWSQDKAQGQKGQAWTQGKPQGAHGQVKGQGRKGDTER